jgi:hypothetical protein
LDARTPSASRDQQWEVGDSLASSSSVQHAAGKPNWKRPGFWKRL